MSGDKTVRGGKSVVTMDRARARDCLCELNWREACVSGKAPRMLLAEYR